VKSLLYGDISEKPMMEMSYSFSAGTPTFIRTIEMFVEIICIIILFLHLLSTNHKCTQPCYFSLLLKPATQKERMDWNSSTRSSRLCVAPVVVPVMLWSLPLFRSAESHHSI
jgi:hypothetical protein